MPENQPNNNFRIPTPAPIPTDPSLDTQGIKPNSRKNKFELVSKIQQRFLKLSTKTKYAIFFGSITILLVAVWVLSVFILPRIIPNFNNSQSSAETSLTETFQNINGTQSFSQLLEKDQRSKDLISGSANFTIFTPSQEAIDNIPASVYGENPSEQKKAEINSIIVQNHILSGKFSYDSLSKLTSFNTLAGESIKVSLEDNQVLVNGVLVETRKSVESKNGFVHFINSVMLPEYLLPQNQAKSIPLEPFVGSYQGSGWYFNEGLIPEQTTLSISESNRTFSLGFTNLNLATYKPDVYTVDGKAYLLSINLIGKIEKVEDSYVVMVEQLFSNYTLQGEELTPEQMQYLNTELRSEGISFESNSFQSQISLSLEISEGVLTSQSSLFGFSGTALEPIEVPQLPQTPEAESEPSSETESDPAAL